MNCKKGSVYEIIFKIYLSLLYLKIYFSSLLEWIYSDNSSEKSTVTLVVQMFFLHILYCCGLYSVWNQRASTVVFEQSNNVYKFERNV